jgi:hypothetical protein
MTAVIEKGEKMAESLEKEENLIVPHKYGCEVLLEKTTLEKAKDPSFPNDAYLIWYNVNDEQHMDLVRCQKKTSLFDMYYDRYGSGSVQKIDFGYGRISPRMWGYRQPEKKKRK